jgi:hypothetical protein
VIPALVLVLLLCGCAAKKPLAAIVPAPALPRDFYHQPEDCNSADWYQRQVCNQRSTLKT